MQVFLQVMLRQIMLRHRILSCLLARKQPFENGLRALGSLPKLSQFDARSETRSIRAR